MSLKYEKLESIKKLLDEGVLTNEEYLAEKTKILTMPDEDPQEKPSSVIEEYKPWGLDEKTYGLVLHLSQFAGYTVPLGGLILPIIMWNCEKNNSELIDLHGRIVINWMISAIIYAVVFVILCFFVVGVPLLIALAVCCLVFPIVASIKAGNGQAWKYPLSISFLAIPEYDKHSR